MDASLAAAHVFLVVSFARPPAEIVAAPNRSALTPSLASSARDYADASLSLATRRAIKADWAVWSAWCLKAGVLPMPANPDTAVAFLTAQAPQRKVATLERYRATVGKLHKLAGHPSPFANEAAKSVMAGIRRVHGVAQTRKAAASVELVRAFPEDDVGRRDRALLLLGLATAMRRSEIAALDVSDVVFRQEGAVIRLRRAKTDQEGVGRYVPLPRADNVPELCPVMALRTWLGSRTEGPLFYGDRRRRLHTQRITSKRIAFAVKEAASRAGLNARAYSGHSLRAGFITAAWEAGFSLDAIMAQTGHKKVDTVKRYIRTTGDVNPFARSSVVAIWQAAISMSKAKS